MTAQRYLDPHSVAGKDLHVEEICQVLVVGAGPAGLAAAIEAAARGAKVVLVDENPISAATMSEDIPLLFGAAMGPVVRNRNAMTEAFVESDPALQAAFEAGVDVRLSTVAWGLYANGESVDWLPGLLVGLADDERSWLARCERVIVAAGRRDMGLAFPGWDKSGILGATAAERLAARYGALLATRAVIVGTTAEALSAALALRERGVQIVAAIEQAPEPIGPPRLVDALRRGGTEILTRHVVREATGTDAVEAVAVGQVGPDGVVLSDETERLIACDAVVLGIGTAPVIELLDSVGCRSAFLAERGGYAPRLQGAGRTDVPGIWVAGDAAGIWPSKTLDPSVAQAEGKAAGADAARSLALGGDAVSAPAGPDETVPDLAAYRLAWVEASVVGARGEPHVCRCEEVTAREILEVRPPRYLGTGTDRRNDRSLCSLLGEGPPSPDQVKRLTRAGMGVCQGRRCREQVACLLALGAGVPLGDIPLAGYRAPVRPLPLRLAADLREPGAMTEGWDTWFAIPPQYRRDDELPRLYTVADGNPRGPIASE